MNNNLIKVDPATIELRNISQKQFKFRVPQVTLSKDNVINLI